MQNKEIQEYMKNKSNDELAMYEKEIIEWGKDGVLPEEAKIRVLEKTLDLPNHAPLFAVQVIVEHEIAARWLKIYN